MSFYDYKYRPQPSFTDIIDEMFTPLVASIEAKSKTDIGQVSPDGSVYTLAVEIPRLVRDSITVTVEPTTTNYKTMAHKVVVKAEQKLLAIYSNAKESDTKKKYEQELLVLGQRVALDGALNLSYSEGVLCVEIPLTKPTEPKKATLSARLVDMES